MPSSQGEVGLAQACDAVCVCIPEQGPCLTPHSLIWASVRRQCYPWRMHVLLATRWSGRGNQFSISNVCCSSPWHHENLQFPYWKEGGPCSWKVNLSAVSLPGEKAGWGRGGALLAQCPSIPGWAPRVTLQNNSAPFITLSLAGVLQCVREESYWAKRNLHG